MSDGLSNAKFKAQFKDLSDSKQASVKRSLSREGSYESLEKLAHVTNVGAFGQGTNANKDKFLKTLNSSDIKKIIEEGNEEKLQALKEAVGSDHTKLQINVQKMITDKTPVGNTIRSGLS